MEENLKNKSMVDIAYFILKKENKILKFNELYDKVCEILGYDEKKKQSKIAQFYTNISLDGRICNLGNNKWDLTSRQNFEKVHIDMDEVYSEIDAEGGKDKDLDSDDEDIIDDDEDESEEINEDKFTDNI